MDAAHTLVVGGATGEVSLINLQKVQSISNHFIGESLIQPQISGSTLLVGQLKIKILKYSICTQEASSDLAIKGSTKGHVKEQSSPIVKTKHVSYKKKKHKKRYH